jgi:hypothetical protein
MQLKSQYRPGRVGWNNRVSWNGVVQLALIFTLLAPLFLTGSIAPVAANIEANVVQPVARVAPQSNEAHIDPRILAAATTALEQIMRVIVQEVTQDESVEALVRELGGNILSDLPLINAFAAELSADAALQVAHNPAVR